MVHPREHVKVICIFGMTSTSSIPQGGLLLCCNFLILGELNVYWLFWNETFRFMVLGIV
ncbi:hypothetical protein Hanom_Chr14g01255431 [Helianthus anomalus]